MAVVSFYRGGQRDVGAPIAPDFLSRWFATRKGMNDESFAASQGGEDPDEIGKMELKARESLGELSKALAAARSGDRKSANSIVEAAVRGKAQVLVANAGASADAMRQKLWFRAQWLDKADQEAAKIKAQAKVKDPANANIIANLGPSVRART